MSHISNSNSLIVFSSIFFATFYFTFLWSLFYFQQHLDKIDCDWNRFGVKFVYYKNLFRYKRHDTLQLASIFKIIASLCFLSIPFKLLYLYSVFTSSFFFPYRFYYGLKSEFMFSIVCFFLSYITRWINVRVCSPWSILFNLVICICMFVFIKFLQLRIELFFLVLVYCWTLYP